LQEFGKFIVSLAIQFLSGFGFADATPLFEKEGDFWVWTAAA
jgi:hypothetical protein